MPEKYDYSLIKETVTDRCSPQEIAATLDIVAQDYARRVISDKGESPSVTHSDRLYILFLVRNAFLKMTGDCVEITSEKH